MVSDQLADSRLEFEGRYAVDGGKVAEWLNFNGEPLALEGGIVISDEGLLGTGIVRSTMLPETVWDSAVQAQVFVPFSRDIKDAYAALDTRVEIPFADVTAGGYAKLDGALDVMANGSFDGPWGNDSANAVAESDEGADDLFGAATVETDRSRWAKAWDATAQGAQTGFDYAKKPTGTAIDWVKDTAGSGVDSASGGLEWSIDSRPARGVRLPVSANIPVKGMTTRVRPR